MSLIFMVGERTKKRLSKNVPPRGRPDESLGRRKSLRHVIVSPIEEAETSSRCLAVIIHIEFVSQSKLLFVQSPSKR